MIVSHYNYVRHDLVKNITTGGRGHGNTSSLPLVMIIIK